MSRHREQTESAARYYRSLNIPELIEEALNTGYRLQPPDLPGYLSNFFADLSHPPVISDIQARKVLGGAGSAALEVDVFCTVRNNDKKVASLVMSADSAPLIGDSGEGEESGTRSVEAAIDWIRTSIGPMLGGLQPSEQRSIDRILSEFFQPKFEEEKQRRERNATPSMTGSAPSPPTSPAPSKKRGSGKGKKAVVAEKPVAPPDPPVPVVAGSVALSAVSLAVASCSAVLGDVPLYSYISTLKHGEPPGMMSIPTPLITLMSCGKSSPGKLNLLKEVMMIPRPEMSVQQAVALAASLQAQLMKHIDGACKSAPSCIKCVSPLGSLLFAGDRIDQPLDLMQEVCASLGADVYLAVNCAAQELMDSNKGKYEIASGVWKTPDDMLDVYAEVLSRHPAVIALVDPLRKEDVAQWAALQKAVGSRCYLLAEETCGDNVPSSGRVLHYTNQLTISDLLTSVHKLQGENQVTVLGCLHEESSGSSEVDLAVALGMQFVKLGGLLRGERTMKYNRLLAIEAELTHRGMLGSSSAFHFPVICSENSEEPEASP